jgi:hypothetical protein
LITTLDTLGSFFAHFLARISEFGHVQISENLRLQTTIGVDENQVERHDFSPGSSKKMVLFNYNAMATFFEIHCSDSGQFFPFVVSRFQATASRRAPILKRCIFER